MIIFVAGMSRAGSMWTYNIVRELVKKNKKHALPEKIPPDERQYIEFALSSPVLPDEVHCIKSHFRISADLNTEHAVKFLCNYRDVRDSMLSYMRFMHSSFEQAISAAKDMMATTDYYLDSFAGEFIPVSYARIQQSPMDLILEISRFLDFDISEQEAKIIAHKFSRQKVKEMIRDLEKNKAKAKNKNKERYIEVANFDGTSRVYDVDTAFQSDHITSKNEGEWQTFFSDEQKTVIDELTRDWLKKHGLSG